MTKRKTMLALALAAGALVATASSGRADDRQWHPWWGDSGQGQWNNGRNSGSWSNSGSWVDVTAPGADVTSTFVTHEDFPTGFAKWSGTSFAAPYAAAAIASHHRTAGSPAGTGSAQSARGS